MKKTFLLSLFTITFLINGNLKSQIPQNEIYGGYGFGSLFQIAEIYTDMLIPLISFGTYQSEFNEFVGPVFIGYNIRPIKWLSVGGIVNYSTTKKDFISTINSANKLTFTHTYITVFARGDIHYTGDNIVDLYSGIALGIWNITEKGKKDLNQPETSESKIRAGFHLNALGVKAGKNIGGFAEFGVGFNGMLNLGIFAKF